MTAIEKMKQVRIFNNEEASIIIKNYLNKMKEKSAQTFRAYNTAFNDYFFSIVGKTVDNITWDDILKITYNDSLLYQEYLRNEKKNSPSTINSRMSPVRKLFQHLIKHNKDINLSVVSVERMDVNPDEVKTIGTLSEKEINNLFDFCSQRKYKPSLQHLYFKTLFITMLRREVILNLNVNQLKKIKVDELNKEVYVIKTSQKRRHEMTAIPDELAFELIEHSKNNPNGDIFKNNINIKSLELTLDKFCEEYNLPEERNISLHSLKKAGTDFVYYHSGKDIVRTAKASHHNSIDTTYKNYLLKNESPVDQLSYSLHQNKPDINELKDLSKKQLLQLIEECDSHILRQLIGSKNSLFPNNN